MLVSIKDLKPSIVQTLSNVRCGIEFTNRDWDTLDLIITVLKPFYDATKMLSQHDASISMAIPVVTAIMKDLEDSPSGDDHGVRGMKRSLRSSMERRFEEIEEKDYYRVSTLLDCKFKQYFFRDPTTLDETKDVIINKIVESLTTLQVCSNLMWGLALSATQLAK